MQDLTDDIEGSIDLQLDDVPKSAMLDMSAALSLVMERTAAAGQAERTRNLYLLQQRVFAAHPEVALEAVEKGIIEAGRYGEAEWLEKMGELDPDDMTIEDLSRKSEMKDIGIE